MALRNIRIQGDPVLTKTCREITEMTEKLEILIEDMLETMYEANGVGLAAPQVGILKRLVVMDCGDGPIVMINPVILEKSGSQTDDEGCLSVPGMIGTVERPDFIKIEATDLEGNRQVYEFRDFDARVMCHENDHLDGVLFTDKATNIRDAADENCDDYEEEE